MKSWKIIFVAVNIKLFNFYVNINNNNNCIVKNRLIIIYYDIYIYGIYICMISVK